MADFLYHSAQTFILDQRKLLLSITSIIADVNHEDIYDPALEDKIIYIKIGKSQGLRRELIIPRFTLLRKELNLSYNLHDVLNAIGIELIETASVKLKQFNFNRGLGEIIDGLISVGFISWIDLLKEYAIPPISHMGIENEDFPIPHLS